MQGDELRAKYRVERDKRLRPDGNEQYIEPKGHFASLLDDPNAVATSRDEFHDDVTVVLIGGGFAGLTAAARCKQAGIEDVRIIEGGGDVGGVWYWNRYPGAMCDTAAMVYLPLLESTGYVPTQKYVLGSEIFAYAQMVARHFGLYRNAAFSTEVTRLEWLPECARWLISTNRGDRVRAKYVVMGTGPLHRPKLPGIPGIETFSGHYFHTSRWDYAYTGGDPTGSPLSGLANKRVGVIGTGATAVQCIPHLAKSAQECFVFQRTPSSVDARNNRPIHPSEIAALGKGWQEKWLLNFATIQTGGFADDDLVKDGWTDIAGRIRRRIIEEMENNDQFTPQMIARVIEDSDNEKMNEIRARVEGIVLNTATAEALKPWYRQICKRPCFHDDYLQAYNNPRVHLVDTTMGVTRIDETGVWVGGQHYVLDCLIFASGFEVGTEYARRAGFETVGRSGRTLSEHWADGMCTMHGIHSVGFPNLFILGANQGANLLSNITHNLTEAAATVAAIIAHSESVLADEVEVTDDAERLWVDMMLEKNGAQSFLGNPDCTPGYYNNEGRGLGRRERLNSIGYPQGPVAYFKYIREWRSSGTFAGLAFRRNGGVPAP